MSYVKTIWLSLATIVLAAAPTLFSADSSYPFAESSLNGSVKSEKGEALEGVLIRAKKEGATVAVTVVSDAQGKYRFPKLEGGKYVVEVTRADGLEPSRENVEIGAGKEGHVDFKLGPAKDMASQITVVDWLMNLPGTNEQKRMIADNCTQCHFSAVRRFHFDKPNWLKIVKYMIGGEIADVAEDGAQGAAPNAQLPNWEERSNRFAEYLAEVQGPERRDLSHTKVLPRPGGRSTHAIFTEYDIPYPNAEPHDLAVAPDGIVWWSDWRFGTLGRLDPVTGERKFWKAPRPKETARLGTFQIRFDEKDHNPWVALAWTGGIAKFDRNTEQFTDVFTLPDHGSRKLNMIQLDAKRGRVWFNTENTQSGSPFEGRDDLGFYVPGNKQFTVYEHIPGYGIVVDSKGNAYSLGWYEDSAILRVDGETGQRTRIPTPTPHSAPRRGDVDAQDRIWFAEFQSDRIGMLDPKNGKITEYKLPIPDGKPYSVNVDRRTGLIWASEWWAGRFAVMDPKTGEMREYLIPEAESRVRIIDSYSIGNHSVIWYGSLPGYSGKNGYKQGTIVRLEAW